MKKTKKEIANMRNRAYVFNFTNGIYINIYIIYTIIACLHTIYKFFNTTP